MLGDGECELQSAPTTVSMTLLPHHTQAAVLQDLLQNVPFHGVQSYRNRLIQCRILQVLQVDICFTLFWHSFFYPILNILSQRCYQCCWETQLEPAGHFSRSQLELTLLNMGATSSVFSQKPHLLFPLLSKSSHISPIQYLNPRVLCFLCFYFFQWIF